MVLRLEGYIDLPEHPGPGGFDHAAVRRRIVNRSSRINPKESTPNDR